ncbi:MFS transporter [Candidimonas humi]|uniref:MFS transporter n=1 Tax=Candidimonas humi TaxID=683355 RepID=A0ABV8P1R2_9BURK|nr:MFS transporter [Candidimonas humi]MBV6306923.1 MFS transporter [Candidimonas humi]
MHQPSPTAAQPQPRLFYGWLVVAAGFAVTFVGFGCAYSFSAFVEPLQRDFDATRGSVSLVFALAGFLYFGFGMISGPLADRWGARRLAALGMLLTAAGLAAAGMAHSLTQVYLGYGLGVGLGVGCAYVPAMGTVQRWFVRRRGFASGLAVSGIGVGTLVMPPLVSLLIPLTGWRGAYMVLAVIAVVLGAGMALLIEDSPRSRGLQPDGDPAPPAATPVPPAASLSRSAPAVHSVPADHSALGDHSDHPGPSTHGAPATHRTAAIVPGASIRDALRSRPFIALYAACLFSSFGLFVPFVHLVPYAQDHGIAQSAAVLLIGAIGVGSTAGRFFLGGVADRMGRRPALLAMLAGMALALLIWLASTSMWALFLFALLFGVCYGGYVALLPALVMDEFGGRNISGLIGILYTSVAFGNLIGPSAAGYAYDLTHSYAVPILASAACNLLAVAILAWLSRRRGAMAGDTEPA